MAGAAALLLPVAIALGALLFVLGSFVGGFAFLERGRLLAALVERHPEAWRYLDARTRRLFEWTPSAPKTGDIALDARLLRQRRLEHVGGLLLLPGVLLFALGNIASLFA